LIVLRCSGEFAAAARYVTVLTIADDGSGAAEGRDWKVDSITLAIGSKWEGVCQKSKEISIYARMYLSFVAYHLDHAQSWPLVRS